MSESLDINHLSWFPAGIISRTRSPTVLDGSNEIQQLRLLPKPFPSFAKVRKFSVHIYFKVKVSGNVVQKDRFPIGEGSCKRDACYASSPLRRIFRSRARSMTVLSRMSAPAEALSRCTENLL